MSHNECKEALGLDADDIETPTSFPEPQNDFRLPEVTPSKNQ